MQTEITEPSITEPSNDRTAVNHRSATRQTQPKTAMAKPRLQIACVAACLLMVLGLGGLGFAFETRVAENVRVPAGETVDADVYAAGDTVVIEGTVTGDLVAAARRVTITGSVQGDVIAAGRTVEIGGRLADDARITGQSLVILEGAEVQGHVVAAGFHLEIEEGSTVASDLAFMGRSVRHRGSIRGNVGISAQAIEIDGAIDGDAELRLGTEPMENLNAGWTVDMPRGMERLSGFSGFGGTPILPEGLRIGENATFGGDVRVVSEAAPDVPSGTVEGEVSHSEIDADAARESAFWDRVRRFAELAVLGVLALALVPSVVRGAGHRLRQKPWPGLGWGLLALVAIPVSLVVLLVVSGLLAYVFDLIYLGSLGAAVMVAAVIVALAVLALYVLALLYVVQLVAGYAGGRWLLDRLAPGVAENRYASLLVGVLLVVALAAIPVAGELVGIAVALFGAGGLALLARGARPASETSSSEG